MAGAIIVEGDFADVPEIAQARERVMLLTQVVFDAFGMVEDFGTLFPETATRFLASAAGCGGGMDDPQHPSARRPYVHIHTNPFQVIEIGGQPQADRTWRDTVV